MVVLERKHIQNESKPQTNEAEEKDEPEQDEC